MPLIRELMPLIHLTTCAFAELTQSDFEKIQSIVEKSVNASEKRIKEYVDLKIDAVNAKIDAIDMKIDTKIDAVNTRIDAVNTKIDTKIDAVEKLVSRNFYLIIATFTLIVVAVGIPQVIIAIQSKKYDKLVDDVEMLKQQRIASP
jgi:hypothetical protein